MECGQANCAYHTSFSCYNPADCIFECRPLVDVIYAGHHSTLAPPRYQRSTAVLNRQYKNGKSACATLPAMNLACGWLS